MAPIQELEDRHKGETAYIVGKGVSLLSLTKNHFGPGPVIAMNQAIVKIEELGLSSPIYSSQKDGPVVKPKVATLLLSNPRSKDAWPGYKSRYVYTMEADFGLEDIAPSIMACVKIVKLMGVTKVIVLACDGRHGDHRSFFPQEDGSWEPGAHGCYSGGAKIVTEGIPGHPFLSDTDYEWHCRKDN